MDLIRSIFLELKLYTRTSPMNVRLFMGELDQTISSWQFILEEETGI